MTTRWNPKGREAELMRGAADVVSGIAAAVASRRAQQIADKQAAMAWPAVVAHVIADNQFRHRHAERDRVRYVLAKFLVRLIVLKEAGILGLDEAAFDLEVGESGLVDYLDELIAAAHTLQPILRGDTWRLGVP